jgi:RTX calcium-binding nonapeptide repeat (4 copies)
MYAYGGDGNDAITVLDQHAGGGSTRPIDGGSGDDFIRGSQWAESLVGGTGNDTLMGAGDGDSLDGGDGVDYLYGGSGNDTLDAGTGDDFLYAGDRNDNDRSDNGADIALGRSGKDWFEPKQKWSKTDYDKDDKSANNGDRPSIVDGSGAVSRGVDYNDILSLAQNYNGTRSGNTYQPAGPDQSIPITTVVDSSVIYSGIYGSSGISKTMVRQASIPSLTSQQQAALKPSVIHVASDWQLSVAGTVGDLTWYRIQTPKSDYAAVKTRDDQTQALVQNEYTPVSALRDSSFEDFNSLINIAQNYGSTAVTAPPRSAVHAMFFVAAHRGSVVVFDSAPALAADSAHQNNTGLDLSVFVTRSGTRAMVAATGQMLTFGKPASLPTLASGSKALALIEGVLYLEPTGARFAAR